MRVLPRPAATPFGAAASALLDDGTLLWFCFPAIPAYVVLNAQHVQLLHLLSRLAAFVRVG